MVNGNGRMKKIMFICRDSPGSAWKHDAQRGGLGVLREDARAGRLRPIFFFRGQAERRMPRAHNTGKRSCRLFLWSSISHTTFFFPRSAQIWAAQNAVDQKMYHSKSPKRTGDYQTACAGDPTCSGASLGENLFMMIGGTPGVSQAMDGWYTKEEKQYNYGRANHG